ncbi:MAG: hypothetical protein ACTSO9_18150 [Candidatus Helarchaeota archaeon]
MSTDLIIGYLLSKTWGPSAVIDPLVTISGTIGILIVVVVGLILCWDLSKQSVDDVAQIIWIVIFFLMPVISWIAYYLVVRKG